METKLELRQIWVCKKDGNDYYGETAADAVAKAMEAEKKKEIPLGEYELYAIEDASSDLIHILGYLWREDLQWHHTEYCGCYVSRCRLLTKKGLLRQFYVDEVEQSRKQFDRYITEDEAREILSDVRLKRRDYDDITENTPEGYYVTQIK